MSDIEMQRLHEKERKENPVLIFIERGHLLAINNEKADKLFQSIGVSFPEEEKFINFNHSIAYTPENVNYPNEKYMTNKR